MNEVLETSQHLSTGNESAVPASRGVAHPLWNFVQSLGAKSGLSFELVLPDGHRIGTGMGAPVFRVVFRSDAALLATSRTRATSACSSRTSTQSVDLEGDIGTAFAGSHGRGLRPAVHRPWNAIENRPARVAPLEPLARAGEGERARPLRARRRLLPALARRSADDVHLRLLERGHAHARGSAAQQDRPRLPQAAAAAAASASSTSAAASAASCSAPTRRPARAAPASTRPPSRSSGCATRSRAAGCGAALDVREADFRDVDAAVRQGRVDRRARARGPRPARRGDPRARRLPQAGRPRHAALHRPCRHASRPSSSSASTSFPGGWIPSLAEAIVEMERCGLEVLDVENLRRHYALTLDAWAERFDRRWDAIHALDPARFDERFRRIWRTYLVGCAEMFRSPAGYTHLFQVVVQQGQRHRQRLSDEPRAMSTELRRTQPTLSAVRRLLTTLRGAASARGRSACARRRRTSFATASEAPKQRSTSATSTTSSRSTRRTAGSTSKG